jgi:hypothetical protein
LSPSQFLIKFYDFNVTKRCNIVPWLTASGQLSFVESPLTDDRKGAVEAISSFFFVGKNRGGLVSMYKLFYNPFLRIRNSELKFVCRIIFPQHLSARDISVRPPDPRREKKEKCFLRRIAGRRQE